MATSLSDLTTNETVIYADNEFGIAYQAVNGDGVLDWGWSAGPWDRVNAQIIGLEVRDATVKPFIPFAAEVAR